MLISEGMVETMKHALLKDAGQILSDELRQDQQGWTADTIDYDIIDAMCMAIEAITPEDVDAMFAKIRLRSILQDLPEDDGNRSEALQMLKQL